MGFIFYSESELVAGRMPLLSFSDKAKGADWGRALEFVGA